MFTQLEGYRTYICAALIMVAALLYSFGIVDQGLFLSLLGMLNAGGLAGMRAAMKSGEEV